MKRPAYSLCFRRKIRRQIPRELSLRERIVTLSNHHDERLRRPKSRRAARQQVRSLNTRRTNSVSKIDGQTYAIFRMRKARDRQCKSPIVSGMFSIRNGFHQGRTVESFSSLRSRQTRANRLGSPVLTCHGWSEGHTNKIAVIGPTISSFARGLRKLPSSPFLEMIHSRSDDNGQAAV